MASGGKRPGAGRKPCTDNTRRVELRAMVLPDTAKRLESLSDGEEGRGSGKIGRYLDRIIKNQ